MWQEQSANFLFRKFYNSRLRPLVVLTPIVILLVCLKYFLSRSPDAEPVPSEGQVDDYALVREPRGAFGMSHPNFTRTFYLHKRKKNYTSTLMSLIKPSDTRLRKRRSIPTGFFYRTASNDSRKAMREKFRRFTRVKRYSRLVGILNITKVCDNSQCMNGATCITNVLYEGGFECVCRTGYFGPLCDQTSDDCIFSPCLNGAVCIAVFDGYVCGCQPKFSGLHCEISEQAGFASLMANLNIDKYVSNASLTVFIASMCGFLICAAFCCCVESKKVELRQKNDQYQNMAKTFGMQHLYNEEFVNSSFLNAVTELIVDGGYTVTKMIATVLSLPHMVGSFVQSRTLSANKKVEKQLQKVYDKQQKQTEWWETFLKAKNELRVEEVQEIINKEMKNVISDEMKKSIEDQKQTREADQKLNTIMRKIDEQTNQALQKFNPKVPLTAITSMTLDQGALTDNFIEQLSMRTQNLSEPLTLPQQQISPLMVKDSQYAKGKKSTIKTKHIKEAANYIAKKTKDAMKKGIANVRSGLIDAMGQEDRLSSDALQKEFNERLDEHDLV